MVWVSILVPKRLYLRSVLEVQFDRKGLGYLDIRERLINLNLVLDRIAMLNLEFEVIWRSFGPGFNPGT